MAPVHLPPAPGKHPEAADSEGDGEGESDSDSDSDVDTAAPQLRRPALPSPRPSPGSRERHRRASTQPRGHSRGVTVSGFAPSYHRSAITRSLQHLVAAARSLAVHDIRQRRRLRLQSPHRLSSETGTCIDAEGPSFSASLAFWLRTRRFPGLPIYNTAFTRIARDSDHSHTSASSYHLESLLQRPRASTATI